MVLLLGFFSMPACDRRRAGETSGSGPQRDASIADAAADAHAEVDAAAVMTPATRDEARIYDEYVDTLIHGRNALHDKKMDAAMDDFAHALALRPLDPRAIFERATANMVAKKYDLALLDLESARDRATNDGFAAQVFFEVGTARAALGDAEGARASFVAVQRVRPSELAAAKIARASKCDADVDRRRVPGVTVPDWLGAWKAIARDYLRDHGALSIAPVTTSAEARAALCPHGCDGGGPWVAGIGGDERELAIVAPRGSGLVVFPRVARAIAGRCRSDDAVTIDASSSPARVHVRRDASEPVFFKRNELGNEVQCEEKLADCAWRCEPEGWMERDLFLDLGAGARVLLVEQAGRGLGRRATAAVTRNGGEVRVTGGGCDATIGL